MATHTLVDTDSVQIISNKWLEDVRQYGVNVDTLFKHGTINAALSNIGTVTQTTIVVTENTAVNANTDLTSYPNIKWLFLGAGKLTPATAVTLTLYSPDTITADPTQYILDGTNGTVTFANPGTASARWMGAVADGTTNDRAKLMLIITALPSGSALYFPATSAYYKILSTLDVPLRTNFRFFGAGRGSRIQNDTANLGVFSITAGSDGLEIDHLKLQSTGSLSTLGRGLIYFNPDATATAIKYPRIHHCFLAAGSTCGISGNFITDGTFVHNVFDNDGSAYGEHGLYFGPSGGSSARNIISENTFVNTASGTSGAITIAGAQSDHTISQNIIVGWRDGVLINDNSTGSLSGATLTGNRISGQLRDNISFFQSDTVSPATGCTLVGNRLTGAGRTGIRADWVTECLFQGNRITGAAETGVRTNKMTYCEWIGNTIRDNDADSNGSSGDDSAGIRLNQDNTNNLFLFNTLTVSNVSNYQKYGLSVGSSGNTGNTYHGNKMKSNRTADYDVPSGTVLSEVARVAIVATADLPSAATAMNGTLYIEDGGAGNGNLVLYNGGQRFRIDGGSNV